MCRAVADLGEGPGRPGLPPPIFLVKKDMTEGRKASRASKSTQLPPLAEGLPLQSDGKSVKSTFPEVTILGADQKDHGLWGRE